jgi:NTE family protein
MSPVRTAFVLSGGGSLGAVQAGMLHVLFEKGIAADLLVATSAGALNAAFVASRTQSLATARELADMWSELAREDVFPVSMRALVGGLCGKRDHLVPDHALRRLVRRHLRFEDLAEASTPLHIVTYDLVTDREVVLSRGPAIDAIVASASIPGVLPPVALGEHVLVDGGVINNTPISHAVELGADRIYVLRVPRAVRRPSSGALDAAMQALTSAADRRFAEDVARYADDVELVVLSAPNRLGVRLTDFTHAATLMSDGRAACRRRLAGDAALATAA